MASLAESADWAALDPEFAAGKRALAAGDWNGAIKALASAGLRDDRNADIQNYLGYAYRRLRQLDPAIHTACCHKFLSGHAAVGSLVPEGIG